MGCDERWVRERLNQGQLKGEKKNIGLKEKWFVYAGEVEESIAKRTGASLSTDYLATKAAPQAAQHSTSPEPIVVDTDWDDDEPTNAIDSDRDEARLAWLQSQREALVEVAEEMMRPIISQLEETNNQLKKKEEALQAATFQLGYAQGRMQEQEEKIKLLPDFQARAEKSAQLEREAAEAQARAQELETRLVKDAADRADTEERAARLLAQATAELQMLKEQKDTDAVINAAKLADLEKVVQELQKPKPTFWQKLLGNV